ncbi:MAG: Na/Pi cotransporter family protein [Clostridia bacterium]|nr:Na/Pi cotransporter family protein [Clostridia bacterium]
MIASSLMGLLAGLAMFLYGMNLMGSSLEKRAGNQLKRILFRLTSSPAKGFLLGLIVTAVIQSSSATTVMVVGFVNSGLMKLAQSVGIIIGANVGTAVTAWILSLTGIEGDLWYISMFKPSSFMPIVAVIGILMFMGSKKDKTKDTGSILLGFTVLMYGMEFMSDSVKPIAALPEFQNVLTMFANPILGVLAGTVFTAIVQSSSASVGILQALSLSGAIPFSSAIPIVMGQNIGTCITALISSSGASTEAKRASMIHLIFNVIGMLIWMSAFYLLDAFVQFSFMDMPVTPVYIAVIHTIFKLLSAGLLLPFSDQLVKLACFTVREKGNEQDVQLLDERLFVTPSVALAQARTVTQNMAALAQSSMKNAASLLHVFDEKIAQSVQQDEDRGDKYEDILGTYLVKLAERDLSANDSREQSKLLHMIGDFERISDHAASIMKSARELAEKKLSFSADAMEELSVMSSAVNETLRLATDAFVNDNLDSAARVEPLEQVVDLLQKRIRTRHIDRLSRGQCSIELGFILNDILTSLSRASDHCSNIAGCVIEINQNSMDLHSYLNEVKYGNSSFFNDNYAAYQKEFALPDGK